MGLRLVASMALRASTTRHEVSEDRYFAATGVAVFPPLPRVLEPSVPVPVVDVPPVVMVPVVRVPSTRCATQFAVVRVWRLPVDSAVPPKADAQGYSRLYLKDMTAAAKAGKLNPIPVYAVSTAVEGSPCP